MIKVNLKEVLKETFPNGETRLDLRFILEDPTSEKEYFVEWKYESDADFATLHFIVDYIKDNDPKWAEKVTILNILYMPYSRMDRSEGGSVFSLKTAAKLINLLDFQFVRVFEPHSEKTVELLANSNDLPASEIFAEEAVAYLDSISDLPTYIFYPDKGAKARYEMATETRRFLTGAKKRDFATGRITSYAIENPENLQHEKFNVVIIDDLTSYGGTFIAASKLLKELGAEKVILTVAHAEESAFEGELLNHIDALYTTNSITNRKSFVRKDFFLVVDDLFLKNPLEEN